MTKANRSTQYNKIRIVGGSGAGKSYLGEKLSKLLGTPYTAMDALRYDFSKSYRIQNPRSDEEFARNVAAVAKKKKWIMDGGYFAMFEYTLDEADVIIGLWPSFGRRLFNTFKRFFQRLFSGRYEGISNYLELTKYNFSARKKWQVDRPKLFAEKYADKYVSFKNADQAYAWFVSQQ